MNTVLVADLGGTRCRFAAVTADYRVLCQVSWSSPSETEAYVAAVDRGLRQVLDSLPADVASPSAIGVGSAGVVATGTDRLSMVPNLPIEGWALGPELEQRFGLPTTVLNDGRASALGEFHRGQARGSDPLLCLFFGTGIGIGMVAQGRPFAGADNAAGEIGHTVYLPGGRACACGVAGHFEAYCGGRAMACRARDEVGAPPDGDSWSIDALVQADHPAARQILDEAAQAAAVLVANSITLWNPRAVLLGGGVLQAWPALQGHIAEFVERHCSDEVRANLRLMASSPGSDAIFWGAAIATGALPS
ncbi:MAG: ROK family protein [Planctomycetota bacterium]|nr:ROK family protein [Planctomycetota bacterium]